MTATASVVGTLADLLRSGLFLRYLFVAALKLVLDFAVFNAVLMGDNSPHWGHLIAANSVGFFAAGWVAFRLNSSFVFRVEQRRGDFARFLAVAALGGLLYNGALLVLVASFDPNSGLELNLAKLAAVGASAGWNFIGSALLVFRGTSMARSTQSAGSRRDAA